MFIQYLKFPIFVYIPTTISFLNHTPQFNITVRPVVMLSHMRQLLVNLFECVLNICWIFTWQGLDIFLCGLFDGNILLVLTTFPYNFNSSIQGGRQLLIKLSITDLYAFWIFSEPLLYKVMIFCLCGLFDGNRLLIWTNLPYIYNSGIQGDRKSGATESINNLYAYCIFLNIYFTRYWYCFGVGHLVDIAYWY